MARLTAAEQRALQEEAFPDRFTDGAGWLAIARRAVPLWGNRNFTLNDVRTFLDLPALNGPSNMLAPQILALRPDYETERLRAQLLTAAGDQTLTDFLNELAPQLRAAHDPQTIEGLVLAINIVDQARRNPDRREPFTRLAARLNRPITPGARLR